MNKFSNLSEMLDSSCRKFWWRKAILGEKKTLRYYELHKNANRVTNAFINKLQLKPQDKVAVLLGNSYLYPVIFYSILKSGSVIVPLNTFLKGEELKYIINQCNTKVLVTEEKFYPIIKEIRPQLTELKNIVFVDSSISNEPGCVFINELIKGVSNKIPLSIKVDVPPESVAVIIYTSGTTGHPKGAMLTNKNLLSNLESCITASSVHKRDRIILVLPMFHSFTMTVCMLMPLAVGGGMVIVTSLHPFKKVFKKVLLRGVTFIAGIPPLYELLSKAKIPWIIRKLLKIRLCISGAAPLSIGTINRFEESWKIPLLEGYGLSETSPVVSLNPLNGVKKPGSVGLPIPGVLVKIVGPDEAEVPVNKEGEIIVKGGNVMKGYYNNPVATQETIRGDWLFTGDIGKIDEDGYIYILDRKKDMILVRGLNVYPREIEQVLHEHPHIAEASVVGKPDVNKGEVPIAFVIPKENTNPDHIEILKYTKKRLADYKIPRQVVIRKDLPRTPTGKVLKRELRKIALNWPST